MSGSQAKTDSLARAISKHDVVPKLLVDTGWSEVTTSGGRLLGFVEVDVEFRGSTAHAREEE
jgi:hypothetical protein